MGISWRDKAYSYIYQSSSITSTQIANLSNSAVESSIKNFDFINYFSNSISDILHKCESRYILSTLYIVDGIFRLLNKKYQIDKSDKFKDQLFIQFNDSFSTMLTGTQNEKKILETTPETDCKKLVKLCNIWLQRNDFHSHWLRKWINRISTDLNIDINNLDETTTTTSTTTSTTTTTNNNINQKKRSNNNFEIDEILNRDGTSQSSASKYQKTVDQEFENLESDYDDEEDRMNISPSKLTTTTTGNTGNNDLSKLNLIYYLPMEMIFEILSLLNVIDYMSISRVSKFFSSVVNCLPSCTNISFENAPSSLNSMEISRVFKQFNGIVKVNFSFNRFVTNQVVITLAENCPLLQVVKLSGCLLVDLTSISKLLKLSKHLHTLKMSQINDTTAIDNQTVNLPNTSKGGKKNSFFRQPQTVSFRTPKKKIKNLSNSFFKLLFLKGDKYQINLKSLDISCCHSLILLLLGTFRNPLSTSIQKLNIDCYCNKLDLVALVGGFNNLLNNFPFLKSIKTLYYPIQSHINNNTTINSNTPIIIVDNLWKLLIKGDMVEFEKLLLQIPISKLSKSINKRYLFGTTPIYIASKNGLLKAIDLLMSITNNIGNPICNVSTPDYFNVSPLLISSNIFVVRKLIDQYGLVSNDEFELLFIKICTILNKYHDFLKVDQVRPEFPLEDEMDTILMVLLKTPTTISHSEIYRQNNLLLAKFIKNYKFFIDYVKSSHKNLKRSLLISQTLRDDTIYDKTGFHKLLSKEYEKKILLALYNE